MSDNPVVHGIILSSMPIGEYDRRVSILTKEWGRISAFARGAQRPKSALVAATQPFVTGAFTVIEGRSSYTMVRAEVRDYFTELRGDLTATCHGFYFCEMAEYATAENVDETRTLSLLYAALRALAKKEMPASLIRAVYEIKLLYAGGEGPQVNECVRCGNTEGPFVFHVSSGGCLCKKCAGECFDEAGRKAYELRTQSVVRGYFDLSQSAWYTLRYIAATPPGKLFSFLVKDEVLAELRTLSDAWYAEYSGRTYKSAAMLAEVEQME